MIERLKNGETIKNYKEGGNSMTPIIRHREPVTISPVDISKLEKGDIVFAYVRGRFFTHEVSALKRDEVQISNHHGRVNGWTSRDNVFGIITEVNGRTIPRALKKVRKPQAATP